MKKQSLINFHSIAGLIAGLFILILSVSGAVLMFHDEIDAMQKPKVGLYDKNIKILSVDSCYTIVKQYYPKAEISNCLLPDKASNLFSFFIYDSTYKSGKAVLEVFIHPQTGVISGTRGGSDDGKHNFMSWLAAFHNSFHAGKTGEWLLGFFALAFMFSIITGIIIYRKNVWSVLCFKRSAYKKNNIHQLIGVYALLFNLMIGATGFWMQRYVFKKDFYTVSAWTKTVKPSPGLFFNFDSAYKNLQKQYPDFTGSVIYFAQTKKSKTAIYGSNKTNSFIHSKKFADVIFLDSAGAIAKTRFINDISAGDRYDIINSQLHMGKYGGTTAKIIYGLFGLTSGLLSITGFVLWLRRRKSSR